MGPDTAASRINALRSALDARAAGCWEVADGRLELLAFAPADDLPPEVTRAFTEATRSVSLDRSELGIVRAALDGVVAVSLAGALPAENGSGLWLRRFGAERSVAVPLLGRSGAVEWVASVALAESPPDDAEVASALRSAFAAGRLDSGPPRPDNGPGASPG